LIIIFSPSFATGENARPFGVEEEDMMTSHNMAVDKNINNELPVAMAMSDGKSVNSELQQEQLEKQFFQKKSMKGLFMLITFNILKQSQIV